MVDYLLSGSQKLPERWSAKRVLLKERLFISLPTVYTHCMSSPPKLPSRLDCEWPQGHILSLAKDVKQLLIEGERIPRGQGSETGVDGFCSSQVIVWGLYTSELLSDELGTVGTGHWNAYLPLTDKGEAYSLSQKQSFSYGFQT